LQALICAESSLDAELGSTMLYRSNLRRHEARSHEQAMAAAKRLAPDIVLVDRDLPGAAELVRALREDASTRRLSVVALARGEFASSELGLLEAGANAVLRLPPSGDWDDRLFRLMHVPVRREVRVPVHLQIDLGFGARSERFSGVALNLSVNGMLVETAHPLRVGDDLVFTLELPNGQVNGTATVVRLASGPGQYGVELATVKGDGRVKLKAWVDGLYSALRRRKAGRGLERSLPKR
jgi:CheY-like chemotaxis protein